MDTKREDRLCQVCHSMTSKDVEDEQHCLFSGPAYSDVGLSNLVDRSFFSRPFLS